MMGQRQGNTVAWMDAFGGGTNFFDNTGDLVTENHGETREQVAGCPGDVGVAYAAGYHTHAHLVVSERSKHDLLDARLLAACVNDCG
jgi:hypothetical protein